MDLKLDRPIGDNTQATSADRVLWPPWQRLLQYWSTRNNRSLALVYIVLSSLCFSLVPVFFVRGTANDSSVAFVAVLTGFAGIWAVLGAGRHKLWAERKELLSVLRKSYKLVVLGAAGNVDYILFATALFYVSPLVAVMLYETWPVVMTVLVASIPALESLRREDIHRATFWLAMALCIVGVGMFLVGQSTESVERQLSWVDWMSRDAFIGVCYAAAAGVVAGGHFACTRQVAENLSKRFQEIRGDRRGAFCEAVSYASTKVLAAFAFLGYAWWNGEGISLASFAMAALCAAVVAGGALTLRMANRLHSGYSINVAYYLAPIFSLGWLLLFGLVESRVHLHWDVLFIGSAAILTGNLMALFSVDRSMAFKGLVLSVWVCGSIVYWHEAPLHSSYYESVAAAVTVFVLLLSFRLDRIVRRIERDEADAIWLWRMMASSALPGRVVEARERLNLLVTSKSSREVHDAHKGLQGDDLSGFGGLLKACGGSDEVRARIDLLASSKSQRLNLGELIVIGILGVVAIGGLLGFLPEAARPPEDISKLDDVRQSQWIGMFAEVSAILLSSCIVFLYFCILDLQFDRWRPIVDPGTKSLTFWQAKGRRTEVIIAAGASLLVLSIYIWLLWGDWFG